MRKDEDLSIVAENTLQPSKWFLCFFPRFSLLGVLLMIFFVIDFSFWLLEWTFLFDDIRILGSRKPFVFPPPRLTLNERRWGIWEAVLK